MKTSDAINELAAALAKAQAEFPPITRNRTVTVKTEKGPYTFEYATLDHIIELTAAVRAKHGLALAWGCSGEAGTLTVTGRLMHASGQWIESSLQIPAADTLKPQVLGAALTYRKRYICDQLLGISASEDDDANSEEGNQAVGKERQRSAAKAPAQAQEANADFPPKDGPIGKPTPLKPAQAAPSESDLSVAPLEEVCRVAVPAFGAAKALVDWVKTKHGGDPTKKARDSFGLGTDGAAALRTALIDIIMGRAKP